MECPWRSQKNGLSLFYDVRSIKRKRQDYDLLKESGRGHGSRQRKDIYDEQSQVPYFTYSCMNVSFALIGSRGSSISFGRTFSLVLFLPAEPQSSDDLST